MLEEEYSWNLPDKTTNKKMRVVVNWNKQVAPCKVIQFVCGDEKYMIDPQQLFSVLYLMFSDDQRDKLKNIVTQEMNKLTWQVNIKAQKDIKKGESIVTTIEIPMKKLELDYYKSIWNEKIRRRSGGIKIIGKN